MNQFDMLHMMKGSPQAMLQSMLKSHPQYQNVMRIVQQYGGDPQKAFYELAKQKGVNPDDILNMLKGL